MKRQNFSLLSPVYYFFLLLYLELVLHIATFRSLGRNIIYLLFFTIMASLILGSICTCFSERVNYIITVSLTVVFCVFFCAQLIYHSVFGKFLALFGMAGVAGQAFDFIDVISKNILGNAIVLILLMLPIPVLIILRCKCHIVCARKSGRARLFYLGISAECYLAAILFLNVGSQASYSGYDIYYHNISTDMTVEHFGILTMSRLDGLYAITGKPVKPLQFTVESSAAAPQKPQIDVSPNTMAIDFDAITASAPNENVVQLTQYFQSQTGTNKNEYTGMFEGYNVIFITAEGFSEFVIDPERTPTLYRLQQEGFVFNNFYTPPWYASTSDGEYANLTGLLPTDGLVSLKSSGEQQNNMYFTPGRQLERLNYTLNAYHNNSYTYYSRELSHPNMGYNWHGTGNWFQPETNEYGTEYWPQSDLQLIEQSMSGYMDKEPFHTYYMSVSGHMLYSLNGNAMSARNYDAVADLPYSETAKGYLACQLELEKAMTALVNELETRGIADRTVIVLAADHIPYDDKPVCDELAGHELESAIEWYQNDLIIWTGSMKEPVVVDKYCYDVDILPTLSNLLGLTYDSRLLIGQDILSDSPQLVCFPDRSFISEHCIYNASNGSATPLSDKEITQEYLNDLSAIVYNKFIVSEMILSENYYQYLEGNVY